MSEEDQTVIKYNIVVAGTRDARTSQIWIPLMGNLVEGWNPTLFAAAVDCHSVIIDIGDLHFELNITDLAGTEMMPTLRTLYTRNGHGFLLVFDVNSRESWEALRELRLDIIAEKDLLNLPIVVVGNTSHAKDPWAVSKEEIAALKKEWRCPFVEVDPHKKQSVVRAFMMLLNKVHQFYTGKGLDIETSSFSPSGGGSVSSTEGAAAEAASTTTSTTTTIDDAPTSATSAAVSTSSESLDPSVLYDQAVRVYYCSTDKADKDTAINLFHQASAKGCGDASFFLGCLYAEGKDVEKDKAQAAKLFSMAVESGIVTGMVYLGEMYLDGWEGVPANPENAFKLFERAAAEGDPQGYNDLGWCYLEGCGVQKIPVRAVEMFGEAHANGCFEATVNLAWCYEHGCGVEKDPEKARLLVGASSPETEMESDPECEVMRSQISLPSDRLRKCFSSSI